jgi:hypothetical protein
MSQYGVIKAIGMSFYSRKLYRDVALNWGGKTLFYLIVLLGLSWIAFTIQLQLALSKGYDLYSTKLVGQVPVMTITKGVLSTPENKPYLIVNPDTHQTIAVIDTSGKYTTLDQANASMLVTSTEVISKPKPEEIRTNKIPPSLTMVINPQAINTFLLKFLGFAWLIIFPILLLSSFIYRILEVFIYSILGKIFSLVCGARLSYGQVMQIMMVALTPTIVCATVFEYFNIAFKHQLLFYFLLTMLYLLYGVIVNIHNDQAAKQ